MSRDSVCGHSGPGFRPIALATERPPGLSKCLQPQGSTHALEPQGSTHSLEPQGSTHAVPGSGRPSNVYSLTVDVLSGSNLPMGRLKVKSLHYVELSVSEPGQVSQTVASNAALSCGHVRRVHVRICVYMCVYVRICAYMCVYVHGEHA